MDPAHAGCYGMAWPTLEKSRRRHESAPVPAAATLPKPKTHGCPHCTSEEIVCLGRLDARGRFHALRRGAAGLLAKVAPTPAIQDSS